MNDPSWDAVINGGHWASTQPVWIEDGQQHSWRTVSTLADRISERIPHESQMLQVSAESKLGYFAAQLAIWRISKICVTDDGSLTEAEKDRVAPDTAVSVPADVEAPISCEQFESPCDQDFPLTDVVAVNFTSGSTGTRKAVAVTASNLLTTWTDPSLAAPGDTVAAASFAQPAFDGWWFDTWRTVTGGGAVVCLPGVNDDIFAWPDLIDRYNIRRALLPAAVLSTLLDAAPDCLRGIQTIFSGGEAFGSTVMHRANEAGLHAQFVNLYGPTEATFATHRFDVESSTPQGPVPIGKPLSRTQQILRPVDEPEHFELIVKGPSVCAGYLERGRLATRFIDVHGYPSYATGDVVTVTPTGDLLFVGRKDRQVKVSGHRVDAGQVERDVVALPGVRACRLLQRGHETAAFVVLDACATPTPPSDHVLKVVRRHSTAIQVHVVDHLPLRGGGKVDEAALFQLSDTTG